MIAKNLTTRLARRFRRFRATAFGEFVAVLILFSVISASFVPLLFTVGPSSALAVDATWLGNVNSNWNTSVNWSPTNAPVNFPDTATFNTSTNTSPTISAATNTVKSITFSSNASAFTIQVGIAQGTNAPVPGSLILQGVGIVNNSTNVQTINTFGANNSTSFTAGATAGNATINNSGASFTLFDTGASAGNATINNSGISSFAFFDTGASAGNATINNSGASSFIFFDTGASAGSATIFNSGANSFTSFEGGASAESATILTVERTASHHLKVARPLGMRR